MRGQVSPSGALPSPAALKATHHQLPRSLRTAVNSQLGLDTLTLAARLSVKDVLVGSPLLRIHAEILLASSRWAPLTLQLMVRVLSRVVRSPGIGARCAGRYLPE